MRARRTGHHDQEASARALAAMAEAARRSRHSEPGGETSRTPVAGRSAPPPTHAAADVPAPSPPAGSTPSRRGRWPSRGVLVISAALVAAVVVLVSLSSIRGGGTSTSHSTSTSLPRNRSAATARTPATTPPTSSPSTIPPAGSSTTGPVSTTTSTTTPTTTSVPPSNGGPELSALDPSSGAPGQIVVITGTNFVSPSGQISVDFGSQVAVIACPEQTSCLVAVPPETGTASSVPVTMTTDAGTSNPLTFTYG